MQELDGAPKCILQVSRTREREGIAIPSSSTSSSPCCPLSALLLPPPFSLCFWQAPTRISPPVGLATNDLCASPARRAMAGKKCEAGEGRRKMKELSLSLRQKSCERNVFLCGEGRTASLFLSEMVNGPRRESPPCKKSFALEGVFAPTAQVNFLSIPDS